MATSEIVIETAGDEQVTGFQAWAAGHDIQVPATLPAEPSDWFAVRYPKLAAVYGPAVLVGNGEEDAPAMVKEPMPCCRVCWPRCPRVAPARALICSDSSTTERSARAIAARVSGCGGSARRAAWRRSVRPIWIGQ